MIHATLYERGFAKPITMPYGLTCRVDHIQWHALGGCDSATVTYTGGKASIVELIETLRCPVTIWNGVRKAWWGYVNRVDITAGYLTIGISLDEMANRIRVEYSVATTGRGVTAWSEYTASSSTYGTKDLSVSQMELDATGAVALRDAVLSQYKYPIPVSQTAVGANGPLREATAMLTCRGWWNTLDWRASIVDPISAIAYENTTGSTTQAIGANMNAIELGQQVTVGASNVYALGIKLLVARVGSPQDELMVGLYELDKDGNPEGDSIATGSIFGPVLSTTAAWTDVWFSECTLLAGRQYGIRIGRSSDEDSANYYTVAVNAALGYTGGVLRLFNGVEWTARSTNADLLFQIFANAQVATTTQIGVQTTTYGQFFTATDLDSVSGITRGSYQDGSNTVLRVIEDLLAIGKSGGNRYLAEVTEFRRLRVYEEPARTNPPYRLENNGTLRTSQGAAVEPGDFPAGCWCKLMEAIPGSVDVSRLADPTNQFIESVVWTPNGGMQPVFRGTMTVEDMMRIGR